MKIKIIVASLIVFIYGVYGYSKKPIEAGVAHKTINDIDSCGSLTVQLGEERFHDLSENEQEALKKKQEIACKKTGNAPDLIDSVTK